MPLIFKKHKKPDIVLGIWHIDEPVEWLLAHYSMTPEEQKSYDKFLVESRKKQWLSSRLLIKELFPEGGYILNNNDGKPFFSDNNASLSLSHSYDYACAIISRNKPAGIDIEKIAERLIRVQDRFLSEQEMENVDENKKLLSLCIHWCAKEAIYKLYGKRNLDFREQIRIEPFKINKRGQLKAQISIHGFLKTYELEYQQFDGYMMVYVIDW